MSIGPWKGSQIINHYTNINQDCGFVADRMAIINKRIYGVGFPECGEEGLLSFGENVINKAIMNNIVDSPKLHK